MFNCVNFIYNLSIMQTYQLHSNAQISKPPD
jgi:hypothetical protein